MRLTPTYLTVTGGNRAEHACATLCILYLLIEMGLLSIQGVTAAIEEKGKVYLLLHSLLVTDKAAKSANQVFLSICETFSFRDVYLSVMRVNRGDDGDSLGVETCCGWRGPADQAWAPVFGRSYHPSTDTSKHLVLICVPSKSGMGKTSHFIAGARTAKEGMWLYLLFLCPGRLGYCGAKLPAPCCRPGLTLQGRVSGEGRSLVRVFGSHFPQHPDH
jgi:hypothetical protein